MTDMGADFSIVTIGSCLSRFVANWLNRDYSIPTPINQVYNLRSDQIVQYYIDKSQPIPPMEVIEKYIEPEPDHDKFVRDVLRNMQPDYIGLHEFTDTERAERVNLIKNIQENKINLFLIDNMYDLTSVPYFLTSEPDYVSSPVNFIPWLCKNFRDLNQVLKSSGTVLVPAESARHWVRVVRWLMTHQPGARFVFQCCPGSTSRRDAPERADRADAFYPALVAELGDLNVEVLPSWDVPEDLEIKTDWTHFHNSYYRSVAGYVYMSSRLGKLPGRS